MRQLYGLARPSRTGTSPASPRRGDEVLSLSSSAEMRRGSDLLRRRDPRTTRSALRPRHNLPRVWGMVESSDAHEVDDAHAVAWNESVVQTEAVCHADYQDEVLQVAEDE